MGNQIGLMINNGNSSYASKPADSHFSFGVLIENVQFAIKLENPNHILKV